MRPVLLGMNNPHTPHPEFSLYPDPPRCAGWNLWQLSGLTKEGYLEKYERRNMLDKLSWSRSDAQKGAEALRAELATRTVVLLGNDVSRLMWVGDIEKDYVWRQKKEGGWWARMPHPSGRCRWWNDPLEREAARIFLRELVPPDEDETPAAEPGLPGDWTQIPLL